MGSAAGPATDGRGSRLRRNELKQLLIDTGVRILQDEGLAEGGDLLTYAEAFRRLEVETGVRLSRAQVHGRIWASIDDYRTAVLAEVATHAPVMTRAVTNETLAAIFEDAELDTAAGRRAAMCELIRLGSRANAEAINNIDGDLTGALWSLQTVAFKVRTPRPELTDALRESRQASDREFRAAYAAVLHVLELEPTAEFEPAGLTAALDLFTRMNNALSEGIAARWTFDGDTLPRVDVSIGPDGRKRQWDLLSLGVLAFADFIFGPRDPALDRDSSLSDEEMEAITASPFQEHALTQPPVERIEIEAGGPIRRDALEQHLIRIGAEILRERGIGHGAENLTYARAFDRLESDTGVRVNRAQVHGRIWESQADYQVDVLAEIAKVNLTRHRDALERRLLPVLAELDLSTSASRARHLRTVVRDFARASEIELNDSIEGYLWSSVRRMHALRKDREPIIEENIKQALVESSEVWAGLFRDLAPVFGMRPRQELGLDLDEVCALIGQISMALTDGILKRETILPGDLAAVELKNPYTGELEAWSGLAIGVMALITFFAEPDPAQP